MDHIVNNNHSNVINVFKLVENKIFHLILDPLCRKLKIQAGR